MPTKLGEHMRIVALVLTAFLWQSATCARIASVRSSVNDAWLSDALPLLRSGDVLTVSFDELAMDRSYLRYRLVHCNADWQPSPVAESDWIDGFNEATIEDYAYSRGTLMHYVNYRIEVPVMADVTSQWGSVLSPKISGNYLLQVYEEEDPDTVLVEVPFAVSDEMLDIWSELTTRTDIDYNDKHQQLEVRVSGERLKRVAPVFNPFTDMRLVIDQNHKRSTEVTLTTPLTVDRYTAVYAHQRPLIFEGGNEYRRMEVSNVHYPGMHVEGIEYRHPYYHFYLQTDVPRCDDPYTYDSTQYGAYVVREYNSSESDIEADYVVVHFALEMVEMSDFDIYVEGDLTQRRLDANSRMRYDAADGCYRLALPLKQGAYNYSYVAVRKSDGAVFPNMIDGSHYNTNNVYNIRVYYRLPGDRTDRLGGIL